MTKHLSTCAQQHHILRWWFGGVQLSLARFADHRHGYTTVLCVLSCVGLVPMAAIRASPDPIVGMLYGILTNILFGVSIVLGQFIWPAKAYWNYVSLLVPKMLVLHASVLPIPPPCIITTAL